MKEKDFEAIEQFIGYKFKKRMLLQQAFARKSYTTETHDGDNNEVLEFIGDKILDFIVVKALSEYYGEVNGRDEFECDLTEGKLTELKAKFVEGKMLAQRVEELGFNQYLIMGKSDVINNAQNSTHVKEDLFEASIGAVAIDSGWNISAMQDAVELMLDIDYYLENGFDDKYNYVAIVQRWNQKVNDELPQYNFYDKEEYIERYLPYRHVHEAPLYVGGKFICELTVCIVNRFEDVRAKEIFIGCGCSKNQARMDAAEQAYLYLDKKGILNTMINEIDAPTMENAVGQLNELSQKGYFRQPEYIFRERHDENGNPVWKCECHIDNYKYFYYRSSTSKKDAKRKAAYDMLMSILNAKGSDNGECDE